VTLREHLMAMLGLASASGLAARQGTAAQIPSRRAADPPVPSSGIGHRIRHIAYSDMGGRVISPLIDAVAGAGRSVRNIDLAEPSLETLFISLTGRKLE